MENQARVESRVAGVRVIKWDKNYFGVAIDYEDDKHTAYVVGTREQALAEAVEIRAGHDSAGKADSAELEDFDCRPTWRKALAVKELSQK